MTGIAALALSKSFVYGVGTVGMFGGFLLMLYGLRNPDGLVVSGRSGRLIYGLLAWTTGIAGLSYLGMTFGIGLITVNGHEVETLRYLDWALTTPALVGEIGVLAGASRRTVFGAVVADFLMIVVGYGASITTGIPKWTGFVVSTAFFLILGYYLVRPFGRIAADQRFERQALFGKVRNLTLALWFIYPLVWVLGPSALGIVDALGAAAVVTYVDVTAKTGYGILLASSQGLLDSVLGRTDAATEQSAPGD